MNVLHLGKFFPPVKGGMETVLALICARTSADVSNRAIVANDSAVTVEEQHESVDLVRVAALARVGAVAICPTMPSRLAREHADVIVIHEPNPMGLLAYFLARPQGKLIVWFHSEVIRPSWRYWLCYRPLLQFALRRASKIIVASPTLAESSPQLREWRSKCVVIPYGVAIVEPSDDIVRRAADVRRLAGRPVILFVGRLVAYKGAAVLLDALRGLDALVLIVGAGPERAALEARAEACGVSGQVQFLGEVSDDELRALYCACDVFVLPSITRQEAFGVVQVEAMAWGKPVISTRLGTGVDWVNQHGTTGLIVPPGDVPALHAAVAELLADAPRRAMLGRAGADRARTVLSVDRMIDATLAVYREVSRTHPRHAA